MDHDHLIGQVQHRARRGEGRRSPSGRLSARLRSDGTYQNLIPHLPQGIGDYEDSYDIDRRRHGERFSLDEFIDRVARREGVRKTQPFHARCVLEVVDEATTGGTTTVESPSGHHRSGCRGPSGPGGVGRLRGGSLSWIYELLARYREEGDQAFEPRSRRPHSQPTAIPPATVELILRLRRELTGQGLDAGAQTIAWHLAEQHQLTVSEATIWRKLSQAGLIVPEPKKKPNRPTFPFAAEQSNEMWQIDFERHEAFANPGGGGRTPRDACRSRRVEAGGRSITLA